MSEIVLCVPGHFTSEDEVRALVSAFDVELEGHEPRMVEAFVASVHGDADVTAFETVAAHTSVVYVLSGPFPPSGAEAVALAMLEAGCALLDAGGLGVKCESSGIAHSPEGFRRLTAHAAESADALRQPDLDDDERLTLRYRLCTALLDAYVQRPIGDDDDVYSCGMHLLGAPDVVVSASAILADGSEDEVDVSDLESFALHVLAEPSARQRETYRTTDDAAPYAVAHEPCTRHPEEDGFWNPDGYLRLIPST